MAATAGSGTYDETGTVVYEDPNGCTSFRVKCRSASARDIGVVVEGLHGPAELFPLEPGDAQPFRLGKRGIKKVTLYGVGGEATATWGVVAITDNAAQ